MSDFDPDKPYNDLPLLPPPREQIESHQILKQCIGARVAVAELKQAAEMIPNSAVLVNALPLLEARASGAMNRMAIELLTLEPERPAPVLDFLGDVRDAIESAVVRTSDTST